MSAVVLDLAQGSDAWLRARQSRVGASELGAVAGISPYAGPGDVWAAKVGPPRPRGTIDLHRRVGHLLEGLARDAWREHSGVGASAGPVLAEGLLLASLDHWSEGLEPIDAKVVTDANPERRLFGDASIPEAIALQVTQQAHLVERLTGSRLEAAHVAVILVGRFGFEFRPYRVVLTAERREYFMDLAFAADQLPAWWDYYVVGRRPPPDTEIQAIAAAVDLDTVVRREATDEEAALLAGWQATEPAVTAAARALADAEKIRDASKSALARSLGPDCSIPGAAWVRHGKGVRFKLMKEK